MSFPSLLTNTGLPPFYPGSLWRLCQRFDFPCLPVADFNSRCVLICQVTDKMPLHLNIQPSLLNLQMPQKQCSELIFRSAWKTSQYSYSNYKHIEKPTLCMGCLQKTFIKIKTNVSTQVCISACCSEINDHHSTLKELRGFIQQNLHRTHTEQCPIQPSNIHRGKAHY